MKRAGWLVKHLMIIGLRIDVDTYRGTRDGVPNLCRLLGEHNILATFFFSVGPDNMGRHVLRLIRPAFFWKMLRSRSAGLYGWDIIFKGTFGPGPNIGKRLGHVIRKAAEDGHEIGLHAWDHYKWQTGVSKMAAPEIYTSIKQGFDQLGEIIGRAPICSAVPGWKCNDMVLEQKALFPFVYNSDCRGKTIFTPIVNGQGLKQPQIPVTLPTYDEVIGRNGISDSNYNEHILSLLDKDRPNVLTIHAEVEGIACQPMFERFVTMAQASGASFAPLGDILKSSVQIGSSAVIQREIPGREGWVACQAPAQITRERN
jgi:undecaprenyl phosphate-alpha-L-ara4FN deformylase